MACGYTQRTGTPAYRVRIRAYAVAQLLSIRLRRVIVHALRLGRMAIVIGPLRLHNA